MIDDFVARDTRALRERFADLGSVAGARRIVLTDGRSRGLEVIEVRNAAGLRFEVLLGRGLDLGSAEVEGLPVSWRSPVGDVASEHYDPHGIGWLRSFHGGLLVGCGLRHAGAPSTDGVEALGVHGRLSNTPAESVSTETDWEADEPAVEIRGRVREVRALGENLRLDRTVRCPIWSNRIDVQDVVTNDGCDPSPHMYLLHINLGFPVVSESTELLGPILETVPRDEMAAAHSHEARTFGPPDRTRDEEVCFHTMTPHLDGSVTVALVRTTPRALGVVLTYDATAFTHFAQWKVTRPGTYATALEPANCLVLGMEAERAAGRLQELQPGEARTYRLSIAIVTSHEGIDRIRQRVAGSPTRQIAGAPAGGT